MPKSDEPLVSPGDPLIALSLLTRIPVPVADVSRMALAAWAYPLAGLGPACLAAGAGALALWFGLQAPLAALIALAILVVTTGAMHEDGLADAADGLWGGWDRARRLEIMKDSRIGAYGVIAIFFSLSARWAALWLLFSAGAGPAATGILAAAVLSRATMPVLMAALPHARESGLSHGVGRVPRATAALAVVTACILAGLLLGAGAFAAILWAAAGTLCLALVARAKIGGQTGDILGAGQQIAEIAILLSILA